MAVKNGAYSLKEKQEAVAYFNKNEVPKQIEELLNKMFKEKPSDIFGYMAEYFGNHSQTPTLSKISSAEVLGSRGFSSFEVNFHCTINGLSKFVAAAVAPVDSGPLSDSTRPRAKTPDLKTKTPETTKQQKTADAPVASSAATVADHAPKGVDVDEIMERIEDTIAPLILGSDPVDQNAVDAILHSLEEREGAFSKIDSPRDDDQTEDGATLEKPDILQEDGKADLVKIPSVSRGESKQSSIPQDAGRKADGKKQSIAPTKELLGATDLEEDEEFRDYAMITVSMGTALTGAKLKECSLYEHLAQVSGKELTESFTLPIPMMTLLTSGKFASGKQNLLKEILILPQPGTPIKEALQQLTAIHAQMGSILAQKFGASGRCVTNDGSYSPALDKPEQALDFVQDAVAACGYSLGTDIHIALNCAASEFYDQEKLKYEIMANAFKSLDDVINLYCELHERYPGIVAIVDGVRNQDREGWIKLNQRIGEKCFVVGSELYRKHSNILDSGVAQKLSSAVVLGLDQANTISGLTQKAKAVTDQGGVLVMKDGPCADSPSILVDVAVALGSRFVKLGGPVRVEHVCKYRRLQQIEEELGRRGLLASQEQHVFPVINVVEQETENEQK